MVAQTQHAVIPAIHNHGIVRWSYATSDEFAAASGFVAADVNKVAYVAETGIYHVLRNHDPIAWHALNASLDVASVTYDAEAFTLTLTMTNGSQVVATNVAVPQFSDASFQLRADLTSETLRFIVASGVTGRTVTLPSRAAMRLNSAQLFDAAHSWEAGDICRTADNKCWMALAAIAPGAFSPVQWAELTSTGLLAYVEDEFAAIAGQWQNDISNGISGNLHIAATAPTVNDDSTLGYKFNSRWYDTATLREYVCLNPAVGAAVWQTVATALPNWLFANAGANYAVAPLALGANAQAFGNAASAPDTNQIVIGNGAVMLAGGANGIAMGTGANGASRSDSVTIGPDAAAGGNGAVTIGHNAATAGAAQVVVGENSSYTVTYQGVIVGNNNVMRTNSTAVGRANQTSTGGQTTTLVGDTNFNRSTGGNANYHTVLIGKDCEQATGNLSGGVAIGTDIVLASNGGVGIGGFNYSVNLGAVTINAGTNGGNVSADYAVNIGTNCDSIGTGAIHIGGSNTTSGSGAAGAYSIALGYKVDCDGAYSVCIGAEGTNPENNCTLIGGRVGAVTFGEGGVNFPNYETAVANKARSGLITGSRIASTDATPITRTLSRMAANQFATIEVVMVAYEAATGDMCVRRCTLNVISDASKNVTIVGAPVIGAAEKTGTMEVGISFDTSGVLLRTTTTGEAAKNIVTAVYGRFVGATI